MHRWAAALAVLMLLMAACTTAADTTSQTSTSDSTTVDDQPDGTASDESPAGSTTSTDSSAPQSEEVSSTLAAAADAACQNGSNLVGWQQGPTAQAQRLIDGPVIVDGVVYPRPEYDGRPWSQWGQGIVLADGRFLSALGDHRGVDGNSFIYEYDPDTQTLTTIADALSLSGHDAGAWGYGKIHAQMVEGPCNDVLVTTYWGTRRDLVFSDSYQGDLLFRLDPSRETIENLGVFYAQHGVPSLASDPASGLVYGEAVDPLAPPGGSGSFVAVDGHTGEAVFADNDAKHSGFRSIAVADDGRAFFSQGNGSLGVFDPGSNDVSQFPAVIPGDILRAAAAPSADGTILGVTDGPAVFFELDPGGGIRTIGDAAGYTTSIARSPDSSTIYYVPDAHGGAWRQGTPLIAVDTATGTEQVIVELNDAAERQLGLRLGGTYSVAINEAGTRLFIGMNAGPPEGDREAFGEVVLLVVDLP